MRFKEYRTLRKILTDIRHDLRSLNMHLGNYHVKPEKESHFKKSYHKFKSSVKKKK